ncbi:hypothetical protein ACFWNN_24510 [Lentzea sp. NPDC058450]|uniref:hypothetical protein n=1 Tax=Lentzea sp. NPDC058450 TaxID=3346505 RepID=UPI00365666CA
MDDLDDELRKLFSDDRLDVHSTPIATEAVVAGANRRRRRRTAVTGTFAVVAVVGAIAGVVQLNALQHEDTVGALLTTASTTASTTPPPVYVSTYTSTATVTVPVPPSGNGSANPDTPGSASTPKSSNKPNTSTPPTAEAQPGRYGTLALGMSEADALATGSLLQAGTAPDGRCKTYATKSNSADDAVVISPDRGIVRITLPDFAKTPKNVGQGSKVADVKTAYANAVQSGTTVTAKMAATPPWSYVFETDGTAVTQVNMRLDANDCASV